MVKKLRWILERSLAAILNPDKILEIDHDASLFLESTTNML